MAVQFLDAASYPTVTLQAGFTTAASGFGAWDAGVWDTAEWGPDVVWTDLSSYLRAVDTGRGFSLESDRATVGQLSVELLNTDGRFTPANTGGPYVSAGVSQIRAGVPIRLRATWNGTTYDLFRGRVRSWTEVFPSTTVAYVRVDADDLFADLGSVTLAEVTAEGAGDTAGGRILRIADAAGWSTGVDLDAGLNTMQATTLGATAASLCQLTADSDGGLVFAGPNGDLVYHGYYRRFTGSRSTSAQITFSAAGAPASDPVTTNDDAGLVNVARLTRIDGTTQTSRASDSVAVYGERTLERSDLICETDAQVATIADLITTVRSSAGYRIRALRTFPARDPSTLWPLVLSAQFNDLHDVTIAHPGGFDVQRSTFVSGIAHSIDPAGGWRVDFVYIDAAPYVALQGSAYWDSAAWDTDTWFI